MKKKLVIATSLLILILCIGTIAALINKHNQTNAKRVQASQNLSHALSQLQDFPNGEITKLDNNHLKCSEGDMGWIGTTKSCNYEGRIVYSLSKHTDADKLTSDLNAWLNTKQINEYICMQNQNGATTNYDVKASNLAALLSECYGLDYGTLLDKISLDFQLVDKLNIKIIYFKFNKKQLTIDFRNGFYNNCRFYELTCG